MFNKVSKTRVLIARATLGFSLLFAPIDAWVKWHNGDTHDALLLVVTTVCCGIALWLSRDPRYHAHTVYALLAILIFGFVFGFPQLAQHPEMVVWLPLYPFYFYSLAGRRVGTILVGASIVYLYLIYLQADYSQVVNVPEVAVAYTMSILLGYAHEEVHYGERKMLERIALLDGLTGAYNRHGLSAIWEGVLRHARVSDTNVALLLFDIDHFKSINDRHGHDVGDDVLRETVAVFKARLRASDYVVRWGGEEFLIVLPGASTGQACQIAEALRADLAAHEFPVAGGVTGSFGIGSVTTADDFETALKKADEALYQAKYAGRNRIMLAGAAEA